ncbi:MAG TPA: CAP domain-containing protein, partial [Xanthobacteraceae bacterium]
MRRLASILLAVMLTGPACADELGAAAQAAISHYRQEHGLPAVTPDPRLMELAAEQARAMAKAGVLEHDVDKPFGVRIARYDPDVAAENIAAGTTTFAATLELWKHSAGHDANLRRAGVTRFGIASAPAPESKYKVFWSLILAGTRPHPKTMVAGGPGLMRAGPTEGPVVRVRAQRSHDGGADMLSSLGKLLRP